MANFQVGNAWDSAQSALYSFNYAAFQWYIKDFSKTTVVLGVVDADYELFITGTGFRQKKGELIDGTITEMQSLDQNGDLWASISGAKYEIKNAFPDAQLDIFARSLLKRDDQLTGNENADQLFGFGGNDRIRGMGGDDVLVSNLGQDKLTGGAGSDTFLFLQAAKGSKMIVTDFDADGGGLEQDYLWFEGKAWKAYQTGDDTKIEVDGGGVVVLKDVDRGEISIVDIKEAELF